METSGLVFIVICIVLALWDGIAVLRGGVRSSVSMWIARASQQYPMIPFTFGVICGHLFARMTEVPQ